MIEARSRSMHPGSVLPFPGAVRASSKDMQDRPLALRPAMMIVFRAGQRTVLTIPARTPCEISTFALLLFRMNSRFLAFVVGLIIMNAAPALRAAKRDTTASTQ